MFSVTELFLITGMTCVTFLIRYPVMAMSGRIKLPHWFMQLLRYVPPTVLTAIVVPAVLMPDEILWIDHSNPRLAGALASLIVGVWRRNLLLTIVVGMGVFFVWQWLV
jgi:branched-subunit amino acid transport protein